MPSTHQGQVAFYIPLILFSTQFRMPVPRSRQLWTANFTTSSRAPFRLSSVDRNSGSLGTGLPKFVRCGDQCKARNASITGLGIHTSTASFALILCFYTVLEPSPSHRGGMGPSKQCFTACRRFWVNFTGNSLSNMILQIV